MNIWECAAMILSTLNFNNAVCDFIYFTSYCKNQYGNAFIKYTTATPHFKLSCWMQYILNTKDVINYISASFKFGVRNPCGWHRHAETCRSGERPHFYV